MSGGPIEPRRLHPLSPLARGLQRAPTVAIPLGVLLLTRTGPEVRIIGLIALVLVAAFGLSTAFAYIGWTRTVYWFDTDGDLRFDSGVVTRNERRVQLSRLQAVDVVRPFVARVLGLSELRIEVAGEGESRVTLQYLDSPTAEALRERLLSGHVVAAEPGAPPGEPAHLEEERVLGRVPNSRLAASLLLRSETAFLLVLSVLLLAVTFLTEGAGALVLALATGGVPILSVVSSFARYYGFTVSTARDGLRLRHGLTSTQSQTVPRGRVQAIEFETPWLWRRLGWTRVRVTIAGVGGGRDESQAIDTVLVPVAPAAEAREIVRLVLPGVDVDAIELAPAPPAARWRSPLQWRRLGAGHDEHVFATRRGWLTDRLAVVPHERLQSARVTQGPWERRLGLASMFVDTPAGPVRVWALRRGAAEARDLADAQVARSARARGGR